MKYFFQYLISYGGITVLASSFIHSQKMRMQLMERSRIFSRCFPECSHQNHPSAMITLVYFYEFSCNLMTCLIIFIHPSWFLVIVCVLASACFPTDSPFLFMTFDLVHSASAFLACVLEKIIDLISNMQLKASIQTPLSIAKYNFMCTVFVYIILK